MNLLLFVLFVPAVLAGAFQAQPQRSPSSSEGVVTKLGTTEPLANAIVQLNLALRTTGVTSFGASRGLRRLRQKT